MTDTTIRLVKRVADTIPCSRNEAEQYIAGGWVSVDGQIVEEPGARVDDAQEVTLHPDATLTEITPVTILLHKPIGYSASGDPSAPAVLELISAATLAVEQQSKHRFLKRHLTKLTLTGFLDTRASGLVVYTQDFRVARKLVDEADRVEQEYIVEVKGAIVEGGLALLNHGLTYNGKPIAPMKVSWQNETRLRFALKGVRPGQILHMCKAVGLTMVSMKRIRIGRVPMAGLPVGQWRYLTDFERF